MIFDQNRTVGVLRALIMIALLTCLTACDPGIGYRPRDWTQTKELRWAQTFGEIRIEMDEIGGLIGKQSLAPQITLHNRSDSVVLIEKVTLRANAIDYESKTPHAGKGWHSIPAQSTSTTYLSWQFNKPIYTILKDPVELRVRLKIGKEEIELSIPMLKSSG